MTWWDKIRCPDCAGDGWRRIRAPDGRVGSDGESCDRCNGSGVIFRGPSEVVGSGTRRLFYEGEWRWTH